ncbi:phosphoglycerate kinase [Rhodomicrobium udaipurense JA643]|nr:phosphoglycerate kinase [Rhodomicrobium udaipurense JA643]
MKDIASADVAEKRVLIRTDLNVPMADGQISDATRIERLLPTFRVLASRGAKIVILSHLGRPDGKPVAKYSLKPVADKLAAMLGATVAFADDCVGPAAEAVVNALEPGQIAMLENVRFHKEEEENDPAFAAELAKLGDIYVNDAFSVSHRAHASTEAVAHLLPAYAGPSLLAEIGAFKVALDHPERPVAAIVGGSKVSTKIAVLGNLAQKMDYLFIGGGMANTFLYADGVAVGKSLCEPNAIDTVKEIRARAEAAGCKILLPVDAVVAREFKANAETEVVPVGEVPADAMILDIGPRSVAEFTGLIERCKTLLWNGPVGAFEIPPFGEGTFALAREAAALTQAGKIVTIAGGGDTVAALNAASVTDKFTYVSTAGGAFLEWLEGRTLPGVAALIR